MLTGSRFASDGKATHLDSQLAMFTEHTNKKGFCWRYIGPERFYTQRQHLLGQAKRSHRQIPHCQELLVESRRQTPALLLLLARTGHRSSTGTVDDSATKGRQLNHLYL